MELRVDAGPVVVGSERAYQAGAVPVERKRCPPALPVPMPTFARFSLLFSRS